MGNIKKIIFSLVAFCLGVAIMFLFNAQQLPLYILIVPMLFFYIGVFLLVEVVRSLFLFDYSNDNNDKDKHLVAKKDNKFWSFFIAAFPIICLLLKSIGMLSFWDIVTLIVAFIVVGFYVHRLHLV